VPERSLPVGAVTTALPELPLPEHHSRNNQLLYNAALQIEPAIRGDPRPRRPSGRHGAGHQHLGIDEASDGIAHYLREQQFPEATVRPARAQRPANFLADWLQLSGPAYVISTACTSSARALMSARRLLDLGLCDAVLCGGVDSLCA
jgi:3-oxoacyl-[acyl-carrier-protein] synthase-1